MDNWGVILGTPTMCSAESNGKLPHLLFTSKTETLVPEFAVADLPLGTTAAMVPEFAVKDLPLGKSERWEPQVIVNTEHHCYVAWFNKIFK